MKLALASAYLLLMVMPAGLLARHSGLAPDIQTDRCNDTAAQVRKLDLNGTRGMVCFRHKTHQAYLNPDPENPHKAVAGAACVGCHHKATDVTGVPILTKCSACHGRQGNPRNPKNHENDEMWSERAFHDLCIGCHRESNKKKLAQNPAPIACADCHSLKLTEATGMGASLVRQQ
jgi:hypothetical protein